MAFMEHVAAHPIPAKTSKIEFADGVNMGRWWGSVKQEERCDKQPGVYGRLLEHEELAAAYSRVQQPKVRKTGPESRTNSKKPTRGDDAALNDQCTEDTDSESATGFGLNFGGPQNKRQKTSVEFMWI